MSSPDKLDNEFIEQWDQCTPMCSANVADYSKVLQTLSGKSSIRKCKDTWWTVQRGSPPEIALKNLLARWGLPTFNRDRFLHLHQEFEMMTLQKSLEKRYTVSDALRTKLTNTSKWAHYTFVLGCCSQTVVWSVTVICIGKCFLLGYRLLDYV